MLLQSYTAQWKVVCLPKEVLKDGDTGPVTQAGWVERSCLHTFIPLH